MSKRFAAFVAVCVAGAGFTGSALAADPFAAGLVPGKDSLSSPLADRQAALRDKAHTMQMDGTIPANAKVGKVAKGQYVQLQQTGHSNVFVILAQFGNQKMYGGTDGPLIGEIQQPDRTQDNSTIYFNDNTPNHYKDLYFDHTPGANSLTNFYQSESSGRFSFDGSVTNWVTVPYNEARYGTDLCGSTVCTSVWALLRDAANQWVLDQLASGQSMDDIKAYLANFDQEDRYDYNGNGNFNEPDGYIDHFQLIHAGEGEEVGGGAQGADAIWSHRWYSYQQFIGVQGPANGNLLGGFQIGAAVGHPTGFWVGDYVMEPENAGTGVIAHETGHDYGLPDEYDTSYAGEAPSTWWTLMSQGSYGNDGTNGIGNKPVDFDAWDKFQLGWLNYDIARPFTKGLQAFKLGPAETNTRQNQGVFVVLPKKAVSTNVGTPTAGAKAAYSGSGDSYDATATRSISIPAGATTLSMDAWYDMEQDWDYAFLQVSTNNGAAWTNLLTDQSDPAANDQSGFNSAASGNGTGISGTSGAGRLADWYTGRPTPLWVPVTADITPYAGQTVLFRVEYKTDGATHGLGFEFDNLMAGAFNDGLEDATPWTFTSGFHLTTGTDTTYANNYYVVENRQYLNYDNGLRFPYYFSDPTRPNWVEHYPFQDGVLVSYWDTSQGDNNTGEHPGDGLILPIDVHNNVIMRSDGVPARTRVQAYDATLSTTPTDALHLDGYTAGGTYTIDQPSQAGIRTFDDRNNYMNPGVPSAGVQTPGFGTIITLQSMDSAGFATVTVSAAK